MGERLVGRWLAARGWQVLAHRFRVGRHDVDLVARRRDVVAFVEVKTRRSQSHGAPEEAIGWSKRRTLAWLAQVWIARSGQTGERYRFDVAAVEVGRGQPVVRYLEDAWRP